MLGIRKSVGQWPNNAFPATPVTTGSIILITASATPHTKGAWSQLIVSTSQTSYGFWLYGNGTAAAASITSFLLDIAFGADTNEVVVVADLIMSAKPAATSGGFCVFIPLFVPKGTRITARGQALIASDTLNMTIALNYGGADSVLPAYMGCDTFGINSGTSRGTDVTAGNTGVEGSDTLIGTATKNYKAVLLLAGQNNSTTQTAIGYHYELRVGGQTLFEWMMQWTTAESQFSFFPPTPAYVNIPNGTQMNVRGEASGTAQSNDIALYCFY